MKKLLKNEAYFASTLGLWLSNQLSDEQKKELEQMFCLDYGGLINACNRYMIRTIKAIGNKIVSFDPEMVCRDGRLPAEPGTGLRNRGDPRDGRKLYQAAGRDGPRRNGAVARVLRILHARGVQGAQSVEAGEGTAVHHDFHSAELPAAGYV